MSILCGIDFSEASAGAALVAAKLSSRLKVPLHLAHSLEPRDALLSDQMDGAQAEAVRARLEDEASRLRSLGASVVVHLQEGQADDALLALAEKLTVQWIVVAARGERGSETWRLGSRADRLSQRAQIPVLVVREAAPFLAWIHGARPLRILFGADLSLATKAALHFVEQLCEVAPCEVIALHSYWAPAEFQRLGLSGVRSIIDNDPEVVAVLERELRAHLSSLRIHQPSTLQIRIEPNLGRTGDRLSSEAGKEMADLIVVGSHARSQLERITEGSVSRAVLHQAHVSVACVTAGPGAHASWPPALKNVVAATDFSKAGQAAVALAYIVAPVGATVHLVHVLRAQHRSPFNLHDVLEKAGATELHPAHDVARHRLASLIPRDALAAGKPTRLHILDAEDTEQAICQAAERLAADVICVGTHGRSGIARALHPSVAHAVASLSRRPVLIAHAPLE